MGDLRVSAQARKLVGLTAAIAVAATVTVGAPAARADTSTCTYGTIFGVGFVTLDVTDTGPFDPQGISVDGGKIRRNNDGLLIDCGIATVSNTALVFINDVSPSATASVDPLISLETGPLAPGQGDEPGGSDEIEVTADLKGGNDILTYSSHKFPAAVRIGKTGSDGTVNLNAFEPDGLDADLTIRGVEQFRALAASPADLSALGGQASGGPFDQRVYLSGGGGRDELIGGPLADLLFGNGGRDTMLGSGGRDKLFGDKGPDELRGQAGADRLDGDAGNDLLHGGKGRDSCVEGPGKDVFKSCEKIISP